VPLLVTVWAEWMQVSLRWLGAHANTIHTVFGDVMEVVTADNNSASHLGGDHTPGEDATTDGHLADKRTLFICSHSHRLWEIRKK